MRVSSLFRPVIVAATLAFPISASEAQQARELFRRDGWVGAVIEHEKTPFACLASAVYSAAETKITIAQFKDFTWELVAMQVGAIRFDDRKQIDVFVDGVLVARTAPLPPKAPKKNYTVLAKASETAIEAIANGQLLEIVNGTVTVTGKFNLTGSRNAIRFIADCHEKYLEEKEVPKPVAATAAPPTTTTTRTETAAAKAQAEASSPPPQRREEPKPQYSTGTGFVVHADGYIVTNAHVAAQCTDLTILRPGLPSAPATLIASDKTNDLALLKSPISGTNVPPMRTTVRMGEEAIVYGFPLVGSGVTSSTGNFTVGHVTATTGSADNVARMQISTPVQPGNSGGPVLDAGGNVVGVVVSKLNALAMARENGDIPQNVNFAIKSNIAVSFLEAHGIEPKRQINRLDTAIGKPELADAAKTFTVMIVCRQ